MHQVQLVKGFEQHMVFLVTHIDMSDDPKADIDAINKMLTECGIGNNIVYFSNKSVD